MPHTPRASHPGHPTSGPLLQAGLGLSESLEGMDAKAGLCAYAWPMLIVMSPWGQEDSPLCVRVGQEAPVSLFPFLSIHPFVPPAFTEHLLCARHCGVGLQEMVPALKTWKLRREGRNETRRAKSLSASVPLPVSLD